MPAVNFFATSTTATASNAACSGRSLGTGRIGYTAIQTTGTGGSGTLTMTGSETNVVHFNLRCTVDADVSWNGGDWTIRFEITAANMNITITEIHICRLNSSNVNQATMGSATGLSISLGSTGVKSQVVTTSAQTPSVGDKVEIMIVMSNGSMNNQSYDFSVNGLTQNSPFTTPETRRKAISMGHPFHL